MNQRLRADLSEALASAFEEAPEGVLEVCDLLTCFEAWERLRVDQRLGKDRASAILEEALLKLLGG